MSQSVGVLQLLPCTLVRFCVGDGRGMSETSLALHISRGRLELNAHFRRGKVFS